MSPMDSSLDAHVTPTHRGPAAVAPSVLAHGGFARDPDATAYALSRATGEAHFVLDVHGGGECALALAARGADRVVVASAVDPEGLRALVELKRAAIRQLERGDYLRFVGLLRARRHERLEAYERLEPSLPADVAAFWRAHRTGLLAGLFRTEANVVQGRMLRRLFRTHLPRAAYRALLLGSPQERRSVYDTHIEKSRFFAHALRLCAARGRIKVSADADATGLCGGDPMRALQRMIDAGPAMSPVWMRAFCTDEGVNAGLPWHLTPSGYEALRALVDRVEVMSAAPADVLVRARDAFDGFELSRASATGSAEDLALMVGAVAIAARRGARVLLEGDTDPSAWLSPRFERDTALEAELVERDRAPIHVASRVYRDARAERPSTTAPALSR